MTKSTAKAPSPGPPACCAPSTTAPPSNCSWRTDRSPVPRSAP
ncbi:hypothetical protein ACFQ0M_32745 [Kitasatospora aburaviensis]